MHTRLPPLAQDVITARTGYVMSDFGTYQNPTSHILNRTPPQYQK